ncbi:MAG: TonB C-terminal domain-containing protein [Campylobacter sp.]
MDKFDTRVNNLGYFTISVLLYLCIVVGIFVKLTYFNEIPKKFTDTRDAFMDIMIVERESSPVVKAPEKKQEIVKEPEPVKEEPKIEDPKPDTTIKPVEPETPKESEIVKPEPEALKKEEKPDLQDLFKSIDTKKLKQDQVVKKEPKEQSRKKPEKSSPTPQKKASDVISSLTLDKVSSVPKSQMTGEYNEYFGKISRILQQKWSAYIADSDANVEVEITIEMDGSFSYDIKKLSYDQKFNDKVRDFLRSMTFEKFPVPIKLGRAAKFATNIEDKLQ